MINTNFPHICIQGNNSTILCTFLKCFWFMQIFSNADTGKPYHILFWEKYFSAFQIRSKKYLSVGNEIRRTIASYSYVCIMRDRGRWHNGSDLESQKHRNERHDLTLLRQMAQHCRRFWWSVNSQMYLVILHYLMLVLHNQLVATDNGNAW